jgi:OFA family oxalate/formate antiporter-like MFS transporter
LFKTHPNLDPRTSRHFYGYSLVGCAFVAQFVSVGLFSYVLGAFFIPMTEEFGWTRSEFTLARSIGQLVMGLTGFVIGVYVDRYGGKPLMLVGTLLLAVVLALHSQVSTLTGWILLNGVGLVLGCAMVGNLVVNVTLAKWFVERRGQVVAWAAMGISLAGIVITPAITVSIDVLGWRNSWLVLAVASTLLLLPVSLMMRRAPEDFDLHPDGKSQLQVDSGGAERAAQDMARSLTRAQALRTLSFYGLVVAFAMFSINILVVLLQTIPYLTDAGLNRTQAALAISVASVPAMLSKPIWGFYIDRLAAKPLAALGAFVTGAALLCIVFAVKAQSLWAIYAAYTLLGVGWGGMIPLQEVIWGSFFGRRHLGAVRSAALPFTLIIGASAPLLVSLYHDRVGDYHGALLAVAMLNLISALLMLWVPPPRRAAA